MPTDIPTAGFRSRTEAVVRLRQRGYSTREIASHLGIDMKTVSALENSAARRKPRGGVAMARTIVFPIDVFNALQPHAAKRHLTVNELARQLVETLLEENLIDVVMDDAND